MQDCISKVMDFVLWPVLRDRGRLVWPVPVFSPVTQGVRESEVVREGSEISEGESDRVRVVNPMSCIIQSIQAKNIRQWIVFRGLCIKDRSYKISEPLHEKNLNLFMIRY